MLIRFPNTHPRSAAGRAYEVLMQMRGGQVSDDEPATIPLVLRMIQEAYAVLLKQQLASSANFMEGFDPTLYTTHRIKVTPMERYSVSGDRAYIAKVGTIPVPVSIGGRPCVRFAGGIDFGLSFAGTRSISVMRSRARPLRGNRGSYYLDAGKIFIAMPVDYVDLEEIEVQMIQENPFLEEGFDLWETETVIPEDLWARVKTAVVSGDMNVLSKTIVLRDTINNSSPA